MDITKSLTNHVVQQKHVIEVEEDDVKRKKKKVKIEKLQRNATILEMTFIKPTNVSVNKELQTG